MMSSMSLSFVLVICLFQGGFSILPHEFVMKNDHVEEDFWVAIANSEESLLFAVDQRGQFACGESALAIVGYARPETIARFCLRKDGTIDSFQTRRVIYSQEILPAPSLRTLSELILREPTRCLPSERGLLFETVELLCFCLGHKPVVLRQRQANAGGAASSAFLFGIPASLFVPHTRIVLNWLLNHPDVWRGRSRNQWDDSFSLDPPFEESLVFARDPTTGARLVELDAQDASVPAQRDQHTTALYIAEVGRILGYPPQAVADYIRNEMLSPDYSSSLINAALQSAHNALRSKHGPATPLADFILGTDLPLYPPLQGYNDLILKTTIPVNSFLEIPVTFDWLFFFDNIRGDFASFGQNNTVSGGNVGEL